MKRFDLKESLYKKYILALEKEGYVIRKNQQGHRFFTDEDIKTLEAFIKMIKYAGMTIESVAKKIGEMKGHDGTTEQKQGSHDVMSLVEITINTALEKQGQELSNKRSAEIQELTNQIKFLENQVINQIEASKSEQLRASMETKKQLNEAKEEILLAIKEQAAAKKKWWKFW
jgi:DNA-binding transcriptional MerR regulator